MTNTLKLTLIAAAMATSITMMGCSSTLSGGKTGETAQAQTTAEAESDYAQFLKDVPSFEVQEVLAIAPSSYVLFDGIAGYARSSHAALVELDKVTTEHMTGYKAFTAMNELKAAGKTAELEAYQKAMDPKTAEDVAAYQAGAQKIADAQVQQRVELLKVAAGVLLVVKDKDSLLKGADWMKKAAIGMAIPTAIEQATYAKKCSDYFDQFNAVLTNTQNDQGK